MEFTKKTVADLRLPAGRSDHFEWDDGLPGFGIRIRGTGKRSWVAQYRVNGGTRRESLGDVRKVELEDARKIARKRFAQVELGIDPAAERDHAKAKAVTRKLTLALVAERYLDAKRATLRPSTYKAAEYYFRSSWAPLRERPLDAIKRPDVAARLQELVKEHGPSSAARARDYLSALFAWSMREGLCESLEANPVAYTNDPAAGIGPRERVLTDDEIRAIWTACQDDDFGRIVRLLLLTGCRRGEIAGLLWQEIDLATGTLTIAGARTKNKRQHQLTLPRLAIEILQSAPRRAGREYVFGFGEGGFSGFSVSTIALNGRIIEANGKPLAPWRLHDLRRTMRSGLGKLGVRPDVAELCINHVKKGVEAIYDRHRYEREIKAALALWAEYVAAVIEGRESNVVALRQA